MSSMHDPGRVVTGGVDTHTDTHVAAVVDEVGRILDTESFETTEAGYRRLLRWMSRFGRLDRVGVEGSGSYGAGLARYLGGQGVTVVEVNRPNRQTRRRHGKSDTTDAESAARAALNGEASVVPKTGEGPVEALRALRACRRSAVKARTQAGNQIRDLIVTAPDKIRAVLRDLSVEERVAICARWRATPGKNPVETVRWALKSLARRWQDLTVEIGQLEAQLNAIIAETNPALLGAKGVGTNTAAALLIAAGDNPERMRNDAAFAALCGANPVEASSGKVVRHRINRGGDRQANCALWWIVRHRLQHDLTTIDYAARRTAEGKSDKDITRCLKRHVARQIYQLIVNPPALPGGAALRDRREACHITLDTIADHLDTRPTHISRLERNLDHDNELAARYQHWLDLNTA